MDPVQLMMAAHQADAAVAAQTPDQALQAAIAQSRPDLWAPLSTNPAAYPDLLGWLASTGNVEVLANLRARGFLTDDAEAAAAGTAGGEPVAEPATAQEAPAEAEPAEEKQTDAEQSQEQTEAPQASEETEPAEDYPAPVDEGEAEEAEGGETATETAEDADVTEDVTSDVTEDVTEAVTDEAVGTADDGPGEADDEQETREAEEGKEVEEGAEAAEDPGPDEPDDEGSDEPATDLTAEPTENDEAADGVEDVADGAADSDDDGAGTADEEAEADESFEDESGPGDQAVEDVEAVEDSAAGEPADDSEDEPVAADEGRTEDIPEDDDSQTEPVPAADEGQTEDIPEVEAPAVFASASQWPEVGSAEAMTSAQSAAPAAGSVASAAGSADSVALPVAPPPSAEDIAAWAETPSGAPSGFSAAQPAVEQDMFGAQMAAQMPPPQQQKQSSRSGTGRLVAIIVVLLLIIAGGGGVWAGNYFSSKDKDDDSTSQDKAGEGGNQNNGQADAAATSTATALPSGAVKACSSMPTFTITSVEDGQGELNVQGNVTTSCAEGDFLGGSSNQVLIYSSASPTGGADVDHLVASGTFDLSGDPLIIPNGGRAVTLRFGEQHYFRTAKDLDLKTLTVKPSFDRGSQSSVTSKSSTNSPMTMASSTNSNANQQEQDEQAAGDALQWQAKHDRSAVMSKFLGKWTPQLSSKQVDLVADGQTWTNRSILAEFLKTRQANPNAVIVNTSEWSVFDVGGWWVTLSGELYATADEANAWCDSQGYDAEHCLAKRMESSGSPQGTTKSR
ncbi:variant leucine-rich repeat-containing protein [Actinomyces naeslundii]|uniref:variant leucine-rich repeat-containing protein n=1 Tax=Actinomyces naeslundii TaxID=1655 RepID=UPI00096CDF33|nr:hypothetical protein [Actinomyces naeslundii]OMG26030.1 hypothetical protein BKH35_12430 [Actinomyces naeslundii]